MKKQDVQPKPEVKLEIQELQLISQVLYNNSWNGDQWQKTITPLINKIAKLIDEKGGLPK